MDETKARQCKLGELFWVATVSCPGICERLAKFASRITSLQQSDEYRVNELVRPAEKWKEPTVLKYASSSHSWESFGFDGKAKGDLCKSDGQLHCGAAFS